MSHDGGRKRQHDENGAGPAEPDKRRRNDTDDGPEVWSVESILAAYSTTQGCGADQKLHVELESRDALDVIFPYDVACAGVIPMTQAELDVADGVVHARFALLIDRLKALLPECSDGQPFQWEEKYLPHHAATIVQVVAILFGDWCSNKGFRHVKSMERVNVYLPRTPNELGGGFVDRGNIKMVYTRAVNPSVFNASRTSLSSAIVDFVSSLLRLGYIGAGSANYLVPAALSSGLVNKVLLQITGDSRHIALPCGIISTHLGLGLQKTEFESRKKWCVGPNVLEAPSSISETSWISRLKAVKPYPGEVGFAAREASHNAKLVGLIPQLILSTSAAGVVPCVPSSRFYDLSVAKCAVFEKAVEAINAAVEYYVTEVHSTRTVAERRVWVVDQIFEFMHSDGWCSSFMSNIGATYMQETCVKLQDGEYQSVDSAKPRAYFTTDPRYKVAATAHMRAVCAEYLRVLGHVLFPYSTVVATLTGAAGSGKSTTTDVLGHLNGAPENVMRICGRYDNHTSGGMTTATTQILIDDAFDASAEESGAPMVPPEIASAFFGRVADGETQFTVNPKGVQPMTLTVMPMSGIANVNKPSLTGDKVDPVQQWQTCSGIAGSGAGRRTLSTPPSIHNLQKGTANPSQRGVIAYDPDTLEGSHKPEHPFILILLWFAHTVGASGVASDVYGLCGPHGNSLMTSLIEDFGSIKTVNVLKICDEILVPENDRVATVSIPDTYSTLAVYRGVTLAALKARINIEATKTIRPMVIPSKYNSKLSTAMACTGCGLVVTGVAPGAMPKTIAAIRGGVSVPSVVTKKCPAKSGSCFDMLKRSSVLRCFSLTDDGSVAQDGS